MTDFDNLLNMTYEQCCQYLQKKYGKVPYDYFTDEKCNSKNKNNSKTNQGLIIHHIDEDKGVSLSEKKEAKNNPFKYQKADRLVYCNYLEHLILHIKIVEYNKKLTIKEYNFYFDPKNEILKKPIWWYVKGDEIYYGAGGIFNYIVPELNDIYVGVTFNEKWKQNCANLIINRKNDYLKCIKKIKNLGFDVYLLLTSFKYFLPLDTTSRSGSYYLKSLFEQLKWLNLNWTILKNMKSYLTKWNK